MESVEMERWQIYFKNSGEDLWTIIDWALTIAAANYPQELRIRRDGFAEKLFGPPQYPPVFSNCEGPTLTGSTEVRNAAAPLRPGRDHHFHHDHAAMTTCSDAADEGLTEEHDEETLARREIVNIRRRLEDCSEASLEEEFLEPLRRLEQMNISVRALKDTEIGKVVNGLRKHSSKRVAVAAKRLVRLWKDVVDEWVKTADEEAANEIAAPSDAPQQPQDGDRSAAKPACSDASQMLDIVDDDPRLAAGAGPQDNHRDHRTCSTNAPSFSDNPLNSCKAQEQEGRRLPSSAPRKPCPPGSMTEKLEAARRRMHEGYRQAACAKKQRTVQVVGLDAVPLPNNSTRKRGGLLCGLLNKLDAISDSIVRVRVEGTWRRYQELDSAPGTFDLVYETIHSRLNEAHLERWQRHFALVLLDPVAPEACLAFLPVTPLLPLHGWCHRRRRRLLLAALGKGRTHTHNFVALLCLPCSLLFLPFERKNAGRFVFQEGSSLVC